MSPRIDTPAAAPMSELIFKFVMRSAEADPSGYFITRWDQCQRLTVFAKTRSEAFDKAQLALGRPSRGMVWSHKIDSIEEVMGDE